MADHDQAAQESSQVQRAREKLKKQLAEERQQLTPEKLREVGRVMRHWIDRHASERINLRDKTIRLFDENKHPAKVNSNFVQDMQSALGGVQQTESDEEVPVERQLSDYRGRFQQASDVGSSEGVGESQEDLPES